MVLADTANCSATWATVSSVRGFERAAPLLCFLGIGSALGRVDAERPAGTVHTKLAPAHQTTNGARGHRQLLRDLGHGQQLAWVRPDGRTALPPRHGLILS